MRAGLAWQGDPPLGAADNWPVRAAASWLSEPHRHFVGRLSGLRCLGFTRQWGAIVPESILLPREWSRTKSASLWSGSGDRVCWELGSDARMPRGGDARPRDPPASTPGPPRYPSGCLPHFCVDGIAPLVLERQLQGDGEFRGLPWSPRVAGVCWGLNPEGGMRSTPPAPRSVPRGRCHAWGAAGTAGRSGHFWAHVHGLCRRSSAYNLSQKCLFTEVPNDSC